MNNLQRDIADLYEYYQKNSQNLSDNFPSLIRMALRLLCETAAKEKTNGSLKRYFTKYFDTAKSTLDPNEKTTISNHEVKKAKIVQLLQTGAHNYTASNNIEQTVAMSIIIGAVLTLTHG